MKLSVMIHELKYMPPPAELAALLVSGGVKRASIKVLDGVKLYNAKDGNQKLLKDYFVALDQAGIETGGWQYVYGDQPGLEGDMALAFWEEFKKPENGRIKYFYVNAEGEYKRVGSGRKAETYSNKLHNGLLDVYLCSYRFPDQHRPLGHPFPFESFARHDKIDGVAPQIYWIGANNPAEQLAQSLTQYRKFTNKPFIPVGPIFAQAGWEPTLAELNQFMSACQGMGFEWVDFFDLDHLIVNRRWDWWKAITGVSQEPPPPPPPPPPVSNRKRITIVGENITITQEDI